ncbi:MAG: hypothetical protein Q9219_004224 [cf. Caloplaca sp. 3 TL-2023]
MQNHPRDRCWTDDEVESAILLSHVLNSKGERLAHLNARFGNDRTTMAMKLLISRVKKGNSPYFHIWSRYKDCPPLRASDHSPLVCPDHIGKRLCQLLKRDLCYEGGSVWYLAEWIALAVLCSGPFDIESISRRLESSYKLGHDYSSQVQRMRDPDFQSHIVWQRYNWGDFMEPSTAPPDETHDDQSASVPSNLQSATCSTSSHQTSSRATSLDETEQQASLEDCVVIEADGKSSLINNPSAVYLYEVLGIRNLASLDWESKNLFCDQIVDDIDWKVGDMYPRPTTGQGCKRFQDAAASGWMLTHAVSSEKVSENYEGAASELSLYL